MRTSWIPLRQHAAKVDEVMRVLWSEYYGAALFGDNEEIACLPSNGCRLEIVATPERSRHEVNLVVPGQVVRYKKSFGFLDRIELPGGTTVGLWHLVGFKLRLMSDTSVQPVGGRAAGPGLW